MEFGCIVTDPGIASMSHKRFKLIRDPRHELHCADHICWQYGSSKHHALFVRWMTRDIAEVYHLTGMSEVHWISISGDRVGEFSNVDQEPAIGMLPAQVCKESLDLGRYVVFRYEYDQRRCYGPYEVIQRAESMIGEFQYHVENRNCQSFVRECKINSEMDDFYTREEEKLKSRKMLAAMGIGGLVVVVGLAGLVAWREGLVPVPSKFTFPNNN